MILIKNAQVYAPEYRGENDILIAYDKILAIKPKISCDLEDIKVIDAKGKKAVPGFIDQHVHVVGGGGESGFSSRVPELKLSDCIKAGVTTLVGLLGTDSRTRSVENLVAKTKGLKEEGITAYCLTGAYEYPSITLTGSVSKDMLFIDEVLGVKIAIADHRCSRPTKEELIRLVSEMRIASLISKKPGVLHIHVGASKEGIDTILDIIRTTDIPVKHFRPTHMGKNIDQAVELVNMGGYVDFTSGPLAASQIIETIAKSSSDHITMSSDSNGSMPKWNEHKEIIGITAAKMTDLYESTKQLVTQMKMPLEKALCFTTLNVAKALELYPHKGCLQKGSDADIVLLDEELCIDSVMAKGRMMMQDKEILVKGTYED